MRPWFPWRGPPGAVSELPFTAVELFGHELRTGGSHLWGPNITGRTVGADVVFRF